MRQSYHWYQGKDSSHLGKENPRFSIFSIKCDSWSRAMVMRHSSQTCIGWRNDLSLIAKIARINWKAATINMNELLSQYSWSCASCFKYCFKNILLTMIGKERCLSIWHTFRIKATHPPAVILTIHKNKTMTRHCIVQITVPAEVTKRRQSQGFQRNPMIFATQAYPECRWRTSRRIWGRLHSS